MTAHLASATATLRRTVAVIARRPRAALWTLAQLACAVFLVGLAALAAISIERWAAHHPAGGGGLVVYLGESIDEAQTTALVAELRQLPGVQRAELVSARESAHRLALALGGDAALLDGVDVASLPASLELSLAPGVGDVAALSPTVRALRGTPGVADVIVEPAAAVSGDDRLAGAAAMARTIGWAGAALIAGLALVIMLAALRVRLERPPREAAVLDLLGAPAGFVAVPVALAGALLSAVAALIAALALAVVALGLPGQLASVELAAPSAGALIGLVAAGALVGLVGGGLAGVARAP